MSDPPEVGAGVSLIVSEGHVRQWVGCSHNRAQRPKLCVDCYHALIRAAHRRGFEEASERAAKYVNRVCVPRVAEGIRALEPEE